MVRRGGIGEIGRDWAVGSARMGTRRRPAAHCLRCLVLTRHPPLVRSSGLATGAPRARALPLRGRLVLAVRGARRVRHGAQAAARGVRRVRDRMNDRAV